MAKKARKKSAAKTRKKSKAKPRKAAARKKKPARKARRKAAKGKIARAYNVVVDTIRGTDRLRNKLEPRATSETE
jgi:hypothetical protein